MFEYAEIKSIHLEITSRCNARCPQCSRNLQGGLVNPNLPLVEIRAAEIAQIIPADLVQRLDKILLCGNYGDPLAAQDTIPVLEYFRSCNPQVRLSMHTNGSGRTPSWWKQLAHLVNCIHFSIDGLQDTNHVYRRGTEWPLIMQSAEAFIEAGGHAEWDYLVFRHNEHQVDCAAKLANKMGFKAFNLKKSSRFYNRGQILDATPVYSLQGTLDYYIERPRARHLQNTAGLELFPILESGRRYDDYLNETPIACKAFKNSEIFISAEGLVFPCCSLAQIYSPTPNQQVSQILDLLEKLPDGRLSLSAKHHPIAEIVDGGFFQVLVPSTWCLPSVAAGKLRVCSQVCGKLDITGNQHQLSSTSQRESKARVGRENARLTARNRIRL
jgi:MoaA/NifB/PqqE/SkfB family radical SAM enzyme